MKNRKENICPQILRMQVKIVYNTVHCRHEEVQVPLIASRFSVTLW